MAWVKLDDQFFINSKARALGLEGRALFLASLCWSAMQMNDGTFPASDVQAIAALAGVPDETAGRLAPALWHPEGHDCASCRAVGHTMPVPAGHITVHEYLKDNLSRAGILAKRERDAARKRGERPPPGSAVDSAADSKRNPRGVAAESKRPVPVPTGSSSSSRPGNSRGTSPPVDNHDDDQVTSSVPTVTWERYAQLKLAKQSAGKVTDPEPWKRKTAENARLELGETAARWWADYDVTPHRLAECLIDGKAPGPQYRRKAPA